MLQGIPISDVLALPINERIRLVEDIWDSIARVPESVVLTERQRHELEERLKAYRQNPTEGSPWDEVKARILGRP